MEQNELPMKTIKLELSIPEVNAILAGLSALPTGQGVWPLAMKIKEEAEGQVPPPSDA